MVNTNIPFYHRTNEDFLAIGNEISPSTSLRTGYEANKDLSLGILEEFVATLQWGFGVAIVKWE